MLLNLTGANARKQQQADGTDMAVVISYKVAAKITEDTADIRRALRDLTPCTPGEIRLHQQIRHCCRSIDRHIDEGLKI